MAELIGENISVRFGDSAALSGVSLALRPGSVHALLGPSGSGKSTLIAVLAGLLKPTAGNVFIREGNTDTPLISPPSGLGVVFQPPGLWDHLTVEQHLRLALTGSALERRDWKDRVEQVLEETTLAGLRKRRPGKLSSGQRQRLSLARAIVGKPRFLLLDEPLAHLDGEARRDLMDLLERVLVGSGAAALIATHQPDEALRLANTATLLSEGCAVRQGPVGEVLTPSPAP